MIQKKGKGNELSMRAGVFPAWRQKFPGQRCWAYPCERHFCRHGARFSCGLTVWQCARLIHESGFFAGMARDFSMPLVRGVRPLMIASWSRARKSGIEPTPKTDAPEINKMKKHAGKSAARMDVLEV